MTNKIYSMLGMAKKAGKLLTGSDVCEKALKSGRISLIIISGDSSEGTAKKFRDMCSFRNIPYRIFGNRNTLGKSTGKDEIVIIGLQDKGFSNIILTMIDDTLIIGGKNNG